MVDTRRIVLGGIIAVALSSVLSTEAAAQYSPYYYSSPWSSGSNSTDNTNSGAVVQSQATRGATAQIARMVAAPIDNFLFSGSFGGSAKGRKVVDANGFVRSQNGVSSGEAVSPFGVWANGAWSRLSNSEAATKSTGNLLGGSLGADYAVTDSVLAGAAATLENSRIRTTFNQGHLNGDGISLTPYVAWRITDKLGLSAMAGHGWLSYHEDRSVVTQAHGSYDSSRWMASVNLAYSDTYDDWLVNLHGGYRWALESAQAFTESNNGAVAARATHLGEASVGVRASRTVKDFEPYGGVNLMRDVALSQAQAPAGGSAPSYGRTGIEGILGVNYNISDSTQASAELNDSVFTKGAESVGATLNVRYQF